MIRHAVMEEIDSDCVHLPMNEIKIWRFTWIHSLSVIHLLKCRNFNIEDVHSSIRHAPVAGPGPPSGAVSFAVHGSRLMWLKFIRRNLG